MSKNNLQIKGYKRDRTTEYHIFPWARNYKILFQNREVFESGGSSAIKSTGCFSREPGFSSNHTRWLTTN